jgi:hypothetical protein
MNTDIQKEYENHMMNIISAVKNKTGVLSPEEFNYLLEEKLKNYTLKQGSIGLLVRYIKVKNKQTERWVAENPEKRFASLWVEDPGHWLEQGITSIKEFKRQNLVENIWDLYKEINNVRPRHIDFDGLSMGDLEEMSDGLCRQMGPVC